VVVHAQGSPDGPGTRVQLQMWDGKVASWEVSREAADQLMCATAVSALWRIVAAVRAVHVVFDATTHTKLL
jgi:hypothetical protein